MEPDPSRLAQIVQAYEAADRMTSVQLTDLQLQVLKLFLDHPQQTLAELADRLAELPGNPTHPPSLQATTRALERLKELQFIAQASTQEVEARFILTIGQAYGRRFVAAEDQLRQELRQLTQDL